MFYTCNMTKTPHMYYKCGTIGYIACAMMVAYSINYLLSDSLRRDVQTKYFKNLTAQSKFIFLYCKVSVEVSVSCLFFVPPFCAKIQLPKSWPNYLFLDRDSTSTSTSKPSCKIRHITFQLTFFLWGTANGEWMPLSNSKVWDLEK